MNKQIYGTPVGGGFPQSDWNQTDETKNDYIKNKPENLATEEYVDNTITEHMNNKVDPILAKKTPNTVLGTDQTGQWADFYISRFDETESDGFTGYGFVQRDLDGTIAVPIEPIGDNDATSKKYVDTQDASKLDKTGGTISGDLTVTGNLTIEGTTYAEDTETLRIADNIIELNSEKVDTSTVLSGVAINKNSKSTYGIMYDPSNDTVKFGEGKTEGGAFTFNNGEGAPLTVRDDSSNIDDDAIMIFDKSKNKLVDGGCTVEKLVKKDEFESLMNEHPAKLESLATMRQYDRSIPFVSGDGWSDISFSEEVKPNHLVQRDGYGLIVVPLEPIADNDATSKKYVDTEIDKIITKSVDLTEATISLTMVNNTEYHYTAPITSLTIEGFEAGSMGVSEQWSIIFTTGETISITYPETVKWAVAAPIFDPNKIYWLSFVPFGTYYLGIWTVMAQ